MHNHAHKHTYIHTYRQTDRQTGRQADRQTGRQADRQTVRQADRQTGRQADRQTDRQADTHTHTHTYAHTHIHTYIRACINAHTHTLALKKKASPFARPADCGKTRLKAKQWNMTCVVQYFGVFNFFWSLSTLSCLSFAWHMCSQILFSWQPHVLTGAYGSWILYETTIDIENAWNFFKKLGRDLDSLLPTQITHEQRCEQVFRSIFCSFGRPAWELYNIIYI